MEIKSFRIKNYRSIKDSGVCYLSGDNITILAGMNESGKTAILEALEDFNVDKAIREEAIPIQNPDAIPEIAVTFEIDKETLNNISDMINFKIKTTKSSNVEIIKKYPGEYFLSNESIRSLGIKDEQLTKKSKKKSQSITGEFWLSTRIFPDLVEYCQNQILTTSRIF